MNLYDLLQHVLYATVDSSHTVNAHAITSLVYDSRHVERGSMFIAIKGYHSDGHDYIVQAVQRGAVAVVVDSRYWDRQATFDALAAQQLPIPHIVVVPDSRTVLPDLAAAFYHYPAQRLGTVGITGTKGKTTTASLIARTLDGGGYSTGLINSVQFKIGAREWPNTTRQSTPEAPQVQALLYEMVAANCDYAVIEATSHALSPLWRRVDRCAFDVAVFTNLGHEHLDYHGSFEQYQRDKQRLFELLDEELPTSTTPHPTKARKWAIANAEDRHHAAFLAAAPHHAERLTYGIQAPAHIRAYDIESSAAGSRMRVATPWGDAELVLQLPGTFNVHNALAALSVALSQGVTLDQACTALGAVRGVRGRMQPVDAGQPFSVIVDYAHNPESFTQVFTMLRPLTRGKLIAVFGSAGERDREKRPMQGAIAAEHCDLLIVTDEDPRREDPQQILAEIAAGAVQHGKRIGSDCLLIADRPTAIRTALAYAHPEDVVLLLGKGHETSIEYADGKHAWDEVAEARAGLAELGYTEG